MIPTDPHDATPTRPATPARRTSFTCAALIASALLGLPACGPQLDLIDERLDALLAASAEDTNIATRPDPSSWRGSNSGNGLRFDSESEENPRTLNPATGELAVETRTGADDTPENVVERYDELTATTGEPIVFDLDDVLRFASRNSVEYGAAEEVYLISALSLLVERHRFNPRFFNDTTLDFDFSGDGGRFDRALGVVNDFGVAQRLPYGGNVSARLLVQATADLDRSITADDNAVQSAAIVLAADVPLLRGAGLAARESLIQASRNLIYQARSFEEFRRAFHVDVVSDYLDLVVTQLSIENARRSVELSRAIETRARQLADAGRQDPFQADLAAQDTLFAIDRLSGLEEAYRLQLDQFKLRIGMDPSTQLRIEPLAVVVSIPNESVSTATQTALSYRLDLQTAADQVEDQQRRLDLARNNLLPDLDVLASVDIPTDPTRRQGDLAFDGGYADASVGLRLSAPLDRDIERYQLRQAQIRLEQQKREFEQDRDRVVVQARAALRVIERARFSLLLQEQNVRIAENRVASIAAAPDRATVRDETEAVNGLRRAEDDRDRAARDLQVAILTYLETSGRLRVAPDGLIDPVEGVEVRYRRLGDAESPMRTPDLVEDEQLLPGATDPADGG